MNCPKCKTENDSDTKFCKECGANLTKNNSNKISFKDYINLIKCLIVSPFTKLKDEVNNISSLLSAGVLALIISGIATILTLIKTIITTVRVTSLWSNETSWVWDNIGKINFIKAIGLNFIIFLGLIALIAGIYYIASLIIKKQPDFLKLLAISVTSVIPLYICYTIIAPILSMIWSFLGIIATIIGITYTLILIYELMGNELKLKDNTKFYLNLTCLSIIMASIYYMIIYILVSSVASGLNSLLNL